MIKLTVITGGKPANHLFLQPAIVIGHAPRRAEDIVPDLVVEDANVENAHLKIEWQNSNFVAMNLANDPFTTINGQSFGKKYLQNGDTIEMASIVWQFEGSEFSEASQMPNESNSPQEFKLSSEPLIEPFAPPKKPATTLSKDEIANLLRKVEDLEAHFASPAPLQQSEPTETTQAFEHAPGSVAEHTTETPHTPLPDLAAAPFYQEPANIADATSSQDSSEQPETLKQPQPHFEPDTSFSIDHEDESPTLPFSQEPSSLLVSEPPKPATPTPRQSLKDYYLNEFEDDRKNSSPQSFTVDWKTFWTFTAGTLLVILAAMCLFYVILSGRTEEEENKAAEAVADIVMALNFAQINHTLPQNQNWSDPDFLRHNLSAILASDYEPLANLNSHGQLQTASYILRIYTGSDLSHFLVIAQPNASILQWLIPKATIIVDSQTMELRKTTDLKILNRLLVNPILDSSNSREISQFVKQTEIIPLSSLKRNQAKTGFSTPKALAFIRPGAENLIYNAIRYYHLGESLIKKAINLYESSDDQLDIALFLNELHALERFPNVVLYSSEGLKTAVLAQKAMATFSPQSKFLFAYLQFDSKGGISSSHLLIDENGSEADNEEDDVPSSISPLKQTEQDLLAYSIPARQTETASSSYSDNPFEELFLELHAARQKSLQAIAKKINMLTREENRAANSDFSNKFQKLSGDYITASKKFQKRIAKASYLLGIGDLFADKYQFRSNYISGDDQDDSSFTIKVVDQTHPLFYKLMALYHDRQHLLMPISDDIGRLFDNNQLSEAKLVKNIKSLQDKYISASITNQKQIIQAIAHLQHEYSNMAVTEFMQYVAAAGIDSFIEDKSSMPLDNEPNTVHEQNYTIEKVLSTINSASSIQELLNQLHEVNRLITMENIPDPAQLMLLQNAVRKDVADKLDFLLLSPKGSPYLENANRSVIEQILKMAWITDKNESEYYLNEFDLHAH